MADRRLKDAQISAPDPLPDRGGLPSTPAGPPTQPNDREWSLITADYQWLERVWRQKQPRAAATRKERIELELENLKQLEPTYNVFIDRVHEYYKRTADPRAAAFLAREKIILGD